MRGLSCFETGKRNQEPRAEKGFHSLCDVCLLGGVSKGHFWVSETRAKIVFVLFLG